MHPCPQCREHREQNVSERGKWNVDKGNMDNENKDDTDNENNSLLCGEKLGEEVQSVYLSVEHTEYWVLYIGSESAIEGTKKWGRKEGEKSLDSSRALGSAE